jgi:hypothetical protein
MSAFVHIMAMVVCCMQENLSPNTKMLLKRQKFLPWDKIVFFCLSGTILSQPSLFGTNKNQACRASLRASQPTNGGRGIDVFIIVE